MKTKEYGMVIGIVLFILAAAFMGSGLWFYNNSEETAAHKCQDQIIEMRAQIKELDRLVASNIETVMTGQLRIQEMKQDIMKFSDSIEVFRDQTSETLRHQLQLKEDLSNKTSKIVFPPEGISVNIVKTVPIKSASKPTAAENKKIKKKN